jgi:hypothetical protein
VRKLSGFNRASRDREVEAEKARARAAVRFGRPADGTS